MIQDNEHPMRKTLGDVPMPVKVRCGLTNIAVKEIAEFKTGKVIALEKVVGEPMDIFIADKLMARGEIVVVNERYGIRLSEVL
ncbi:MAG: flagellar motor switch protein FliN [Proteobacteria bacterium]|nr:flagellar motor switch protein FliN [Pseudomonadota bacterium]